MLDSESCVEVLLDEKFMKSIDTLLSHKWNDTSIRENLNYLYDFLEKANKTMKYRQYNIAHMLSIRRS
jgi:hypothetical protein